MKPGYTIWTWGLKDKEDFKQALKEVKEAGFDYIENFDGLADLYFDEIVEFQSTLSAYDMKFINIYDYIRDVREDHMPRAAKLLEFLYRNGAKFMNIQAPPRPEFGPTTKDLDDFIGIVNQVGRMASDYGVRLCVHPHMETTVEQDHEIEYVVNHMDQGSVGLCMDTAHTTLAGMDCVKAFEKYARQISYVHLKDAFKNQDVAAIRKNWRDRAWWEAKNKIFYELGEGDVDFKGVIAVLKKAGYNGYLTVELDHTRYTNKESAIMSRRFLKESLGL